MADPQQFVEITNSSTAPLTVSADSGAPLFMRIVSQDASNTGGGLTPFMGVVSSAATVVINSGPRRLFGMSVFNPSSTAPVFLKVYNDTAVALGTDSAVFDIGVPILTSVPLDFTNIGVSFSAGISLAAAATAGSTVHDTPSSALVVNAWYR